MTRWAHRDEALARARHCRTPDPVTFTDKLGNVRGPFCNKCDGDVFVESMRTEVIPHGRGADSTSESV